MTLLNVITIDGPAGSGKSTVAKLVASQLGWVYVTTGAIYRALALLLHEAGIDMDVEELSHTERYISFINDRYRQESRSGRVFLGEREITEQIKSPLISKLASVYAQNPMIRDRLLPLQRRVVLETNGAVVDGRDMGTVVFTDAGLKIYLTATPEERAKRRYSELLASAEGALNFDTVLKDIYERDARDMNRETAPLRPAHDAVIIDSTDKKQEDIAKLVLHMALQKKLVDLSP